MEGSPMQAKAGLGGGKKLAVLLLPWAFLVVFGFLYLRVLLPRAQEGHALAVCLGAFIALVFVSFLVAAVSFSRDVLAGRYPTH